MAKQPVGDNIGAWSMNHFSRVGLSRCAAVLRALTLGLIVIAAGLLPSTPTYAAATPAEVFVQQNVHNGLAVLNDRGLTPQERDMRQFCALERRYSPACHPRRQAWPSIFNLSPAERRPISMALLPNWASVPQNCVAAICWCKNKKPRSSQLDEKPAFRPDARKGPLAAVQKSGFSATGM
jgi:hypothetical protein